jgi:hypothetical protein
VEGLEVDGKGKKKIGVRKKKEKVKEKEKERDPEKMKEREEKERKAKYEMIIRDGAIRGLCVIVNTYPFSIPSFLPPLLLPLSRVPGEDEGNYFV